MSDEFAPVYACFRRLGRLAFCTVRARMLNPILVVESRRHTRERIVGALDRAGFVGIPAATGREALAYLGVGGGASVILLEGTTSGDTWAHFRDAQRRDENLARIPLIAISAANADALEPIAFDEPADLAALVSIVQHLCAADRTARPLHQRW
jgi:CheY-like chemotaxis protein